MLQTISVNIFNLNRSSFLEVPQNVLQFEYIQIVFKIAISPMVNLGQNIIAMIPIDFHINQNMF